MAHFSLEALLIISYLLRIELDAHGQQVAKATELPTTVVYPILDELAEDGYLHKRTEYFNTAGPPGPPRNYYWIVPSRLYTLYSRVYQIRHRLRLAEREVST